MSNPPSDIYKQLFGDPQALTQEQRAILDSIPIRGAAADALSADKPVAQRYSVDADPDGIRALVADAIHGALAFGFQGVKPPPEGHWLTMFWQMGRDALAAQPAAEPAGIETRAYADGTTATGPAPLPDHSPNEQIEYLDVRNHVLERGMRALMARLATLLDEVQFKDCEDIVRRAGVAPVEQPAGGAVPEGCTPADARVLREANHQLAETEYRLRQALRFYAAKEHFSVSDDTAWDTVSGEPQNYWCDEAGTAMVEDGSIAAAALRGAHLVWEEGEEPPVCPGEPEHGTGSSNAEAGHE